jgi:hypothetical protein
VALVRKPPGSIPESSWRSNMKLIQGEEITTVSSQILFIALLERFNDFMK